MPSHRLPTNRSSSKKTGAAVESLETRTLLAGGLGWPHPALALADSPPAVTTAIDPGSAPAVGGLVFNHRVTITGHTTPGAVVRLRLGDGNSSAQRTRADAQGDYRMTIRVPAGSTTLQVSAIDAAGRRAAASMTIICPNLVIAWNAAALQAIRLDRTPPPNAARDLAILQRAIDRAVETVASRQSESPVVAAMESTAAAQAGHDALVALFPDQAAMFDAALGASLAGLPAGRAQARGMAIGGSAAAAELAARSQDGSNAVVSYTPSTSTGLWRPTPPGFAGALDPQWGHVTPFVLASPSQFRPPSPPALDSPEYATALNEVESLGAANSTTRTPDQTQIALFWNDGSGTSTPPGHWNEIAAAVALQRHDGLLKDARLFARLDTALADAAIACWDAKFAYNLWRPVTAIHSADQDGNPQTTTDPTWAPLIATPPFPSYVSGHSTFSAAAATVLTHAFGPDVQLAVTSDSLPGVVRHYASFQAAAQEAGMSRIYGGIHYSFDNTAGQALGNAVGEYVISHWAQP